MKKTHEKSSIYAVTGTDSVKNIKKTVLQMEATGHTSGGMLVYLVETVAAEDYDRTTAEGRAAAAEKELEEYKKEFFETTDNLNAEKEALLHNYYASVLLFPKNSNGILIRNGR